jgi:hypothetical protein
VKSAPARLREWRDSPVAFALQCLGAAPDAWQVEVLEAIVRNDRLALKASKGPGKSTVLAWVVWWWLATRPHPKVVCTSVTEDNLKDGLWTELAKWQQKSPFLKAAFKWKSERIEAIDHPETWWASARTWPKGGDSSQQANTLAGVHADHVLFVIDEAGGVPDAVAAAAEGGLANADKEAGREAKLLIAGNPTHLEGPLYRACTLEKPLWWVKEISGDPDDPNRAPRVSIEWARAQIAKYGRDNPFVLVNVFGQFPPASSNALLGVEEVAAAQRRVVLEADLREAVKVMGVDVARFGDDRSVITLRHGDACLQPLILRNLDTMQLAGQVARAYDKHQPDGLFIDQATFGAGVLDRLVQLGYPAIGIDSAGSPIDAKFANRRAEMWFNMADWVRARGALPSNPEYNAELVAPAYKFDSNNRLLLEKKVEVKKRTGVSPDVADSLGFTFAQPVMPRALREAIQGRSRTGKQADYNPFER